MSETNTETKEVVVAERTEKLVAALYLVTGLLSDSDPMKGTLRKNALSLLSQVNLLAHDTVKDSICLYQESLSLVSGIQTELSVARVSSTLSEMNSSLLLQGFSSLKNALLESKKSLLAPVSEAALFSHIGSPLGSKVSEESSMLAPSFRQVSEPSMKRFEEKVPAGGVRIILPREEVLAKTNSFLQSASSSLSESGVRLERKMQAGVFKARKVSRREQIVSLFVKGRDMSIKDISSKIKGCSEKTIQRELNTLVFDHVIERIGEKRWSRYVIR